MWRSPTASLSLGVALGMGAVLLYELLLRRKQMPKGFLYFNENRCWEVQGGLKAKRRRSGAIGHLCGDHVDVWPVSLLNRLR